MRLATEVSRPAGEDKFIIKIVDLDRNPEHRTLTKTDLDCHFLENRGLSESISIVFNTIIEEIVDIIEERHKTKVLEEYDEKEILDVNPQDLMVPPSPEDLSELEGG